MSSNNRGQSSSSGQDDDHSWREIGVWYGIPGESAFQVKVPAQILLEIERGES